MLRWLSWLGLSRRVPFHPVWKAGQYVTYYFEHDNGSWAAIALRVTGQVEGGGWAIVGNFKKRGGECTVLFQSDSVTPKNAPDPVPVKTQITRESPSSSSDELTRILDHPTTAISMALNLFTARRSPDAARILSKEANAVCYPCGIEKAHRFITPGPGYLKYYDLCPRVMLTGVACLSIDCGKNPITVTSFGLNDPDAEEPTTYDDFVDLSHPKLIVHQGFTLTYPATWFLMRQPDEEKDGLQINCFATLIGGRSCSLYCSVQIYSGESSRVAVEQQSTRVKFSGALSNLSPRPAPNLRLTGDATGHLFDQAHPWIDGIACVGIFGTDTRERFALVTIFGNISKASPRRDSTMAEFERLFIEIIESFQFC